MNKFLLFISLIFFSLAIMTNFLLKIKQPSWQSATIDPDRARRFVTVLMHNHSPSVLYFDEKDLGGVLFSQPCKDSPCEANTWSTQTLDKGEQMGMFTTGVYDEKGILHVVYQDGTLGREKLYYTNYDGKNWSKKEVVDDAASNGINVGVFTSISIMKQCNNATMKQPASPAGRCNNVPVIFYHTEQGQKFGFARRSLLDPRSSSGVGGEGGLPKWEKKTLETGVGWLTTTTSCGGNVFAAYRSRDTQEVHLGQLKSQNSKVKSQQNELFNNETMQQCNNGLCWSSLPLEASASTGLAITVRNNLPRRQAGEAMKQSSNDSLCSPFVSYFAPSDNTGHGKISFYDATAKKLSTIDPDGYLSRISLASNKSGFHVVYNVEDKGLFYATSPDGVDWKTQLMAPGKYTGSYNSLSVDEAGNIAIAYVDGNALKFMEYNVSSANTIKNIKTILSISLIALGILGLAVNFKRKKKHG